jgi:hypothetical protein
LSRKSGVGNREQGTGNREQVARSRYQVSGNKGRGHNELSTRPDHKQQSPTPHSRKDDDGTMYNPFAEAFKKMGKK